MLVMLVLIWLNGAKFVAWSRSVMHMLMWPLTMVVVGLMRVSLMLAETCVGSAGDGVLKCYSTSLLHCTSCGQR